MILVYHSYTTHMCALVRQVPSSCTEIPVARRFPKPVLCHGEYSRFCLQGGRIRGKPGRGRYPTRFATVRVSNEAMLYLVPRTALSEDSHRSESDAQAPLFFAAKFSYGLGVGASPSTVTGRWQ